VCGVKLKFVTDFKYFGNIINNKLSNSDDIKREIKNLFVRCNKLVTVNVLRIFFGFKTIAWRALSP